MVDNCIKVSMFGSILAITMLGRCRSGTLFIVLLFSAFLFVVFGLGVSFGGFFAFFVLVAGWCCDCWVSVWIEQFDNFVFLMTGVHIDLLAWIYFNLRLSL